MTTTAMLDTETQAVHSTESLISNKRLWAGPRTADTFSSAGRKHEALQIATRGGSNRANGLPGIGHRRPRCGVLISMLLYLLPRTAILGAILLTGCLVGAVASQVRVRAMSFNIIFPVFIGALLWGGLWLRDRHLRALIPLRAR